jgi:glycosyltransferase involved in cell wall biosynthesis
MDISVIIPLYNEVESLPELHRWISNVMVANGFSYEIILIDDGSDDGSWQWIEKESGDDPNLKGVRFRRNYGKSAALHTGFEEAKGDVVITMDADLQVSIWFRVGKRSVTTRSQKLYPVNFTMQLPVTLPE